MAEKLRIGLTMRVMNAPTYHEPRDALAQDWPAFLQAALPEAAWLPLPNLGASSILAYCRQWGINRLILTGGEDPGSQPLRDAGENALLNWAAQARLPVLGVCRGMQMMAVAAGGELKPVTDHVRTEHQLQGRLSHRVNSFHQLGLAACPPGFEITARAEDGEIEAIAHLALPWQGWMWHPERRTPADPADIVQLRKLFT